MKILSLFDGMACGMIAMLNAGIEVESYDAYEIDKYAIKVSSHNFPNINHHGDVFQADFTQYEGVDFLVGGSPCTYWSIAQKNNRETEASGMGWELFSQYVRAVKEAKPKFFIYENNKSMSAAIRESIDKAFGFEAVHINSALVSAQNRQRLYWVGMRNPDGTYSKVPVDQPKDAGILLTDILESGTVDREKSYPLLVSHQGNPRDYFKKQHAQIVFEPVRIPDYGSEAKSRPVTACYAYKGSGEGSLLSECFPDNPSKQVRDYVAEPVAINTTADGKARTVRASCYKDGIRNMVGNDVDLRTCVAEPVPFVLGKLDAAVDKFGYIPKMWNPYNNAEITDKAPTQTAQCGSQTVSATIMLDSCATIIECNDDGKPTKAVSHADGKTHLVYEVKDGQITIKDNRYPVKLADGFYIIRKLTVTECMRLQTVPEWYDFSVISNSQAYKCLSNGWTCDVITHLINATQIEGRKKWLDDLLGDCL